MMVGMGEVVVGVGRLLTRGRHHQLPHAAPPVLLSTMASTMVARNRFLPLNIGHRLSCYNVTF